jgi:hypothetical protein
MTARASCGAQPRALGCAGGEAVSVLKPPGAGAPLGHESASLPKTRRLPCSPRGAGPGDQWSGRRIPTRKQGRFWARDRMRGGAIAKGRATGIIGASPKHSQAGR